MSNPPRGPPGAPVQRWVSPAPPSSPRPTRGGSTRNLALIMIAEKERHTESDAPGVGPDIRLRKAFELGANRNVVCEPRFGQRDGRLRFPNTLLRRSHVRSLIDGRFDSEPGTHG